MLEIPEYEQQEIARRAFRDQLHALIRSNPHGVRADHLHDAFRDRVDEADLIEDLWVLGEELKMLSYDGPFIHRLTVWTSTDHGLVTEFDDFELGHLA